MRVVVNENLIKKRSQTTQRAIVLGVGLLGVAVVLSFNPRYLLPAYGLILPGMILSSWAMRASDKWLRNPRTDQLLAKALKGLTQGYRLYSHVLPAEQTLSSPAGLFILRVKHQEGRISCRGENWRRPLKLGRIVGWMAEEPLGNPSKQARAEAQKMQQFVSQHLPNTEVPIHPLVIFDSSKTELDISQPTVPVLALSDLKGYLRDQEKSKAMSKQTQEALLRLLDEQSTP